MHGNDHDHDDTDERHTDRSRGDASRREFLQATAGAGALAAGLGAGLTGTAAAAGIPTPWLERDGNLLRDPSGNKVILRGVNIPDPYRAARDAPYYKRRAETLIEMATDESEGWHSHVIRIPMQPNDIAREGAGSVDPVAFTQDQLDSYLEQYVDPAVDTAEEEGAYVILDYHRHWPDGPDWDDPALDDEIRMFWETVAPRYAERSHVLYEVFNEPTEPYAGDDIYQGGPDVTDPESEQTWLDWRETAQPWVDLIREHAPRNPLIVGSPRWSQWTYWAPEHEFEGDNLAYAGHVYTQDNLRPLSTYFGEPGEEVPVFMSEFGWGGHEPQLVGDTETYAPQFEELYDEYDLHWQAWCFDFDWEPGMLNRQYEVEEGWGTWVKDRLEAKKDQDVPSSDAVDDATPPTPPTDLTAADATDSSVALSWDGATDEGGSGLARYVVHVDGVRDQSVPAGVTSATVTDLAADTAYEFEVTAVDGAGNASDAASVTASTLMDGQGGDEDAASPTEPGDLTVVGETETAIDVAWDASTDEGGSGLDHYAVYVDGSLDQTVDAGTTEATIDGLAPGTDYEIEVSAIDGAGNQSSMASVDATTAGDGGDAPTLSVELARSEVDADETAEATLLLDEAPDGLAGYTVTAEVADTSVAVVEDAAYPDAFGLTEDAEFAADNSAVTLKAVDLNDEIQPGDENVELATVEIAAVDEGQTPIGVAVDTLDSDDDGADVDPAVAGGTLAVSVRDRDEMTRIEGELPRDIDGDGVYEDLNASGDLDSDDVVLFFEYFDEPAIQDHPEAYDVNGSGELDFDDVTTLFDEL